MTQVNSLLLL